MYATTHAEQRAGEASIHPYQESHMIISKLGKLGTH
jgi:hypothetical protein